MRFGVLKLKWDGQDGAAPWDAWPNDFLASVFQGPEPWSVRSFWKDCTYGLRYPDFDLEPMYAAPAAPGLPTGWRRWPHPFSADRSGTWVDGVTFAKSHGLDGNLYDTYLVLVHPPPSNAGGGQLDLGGWLDFYNHEIGHALGFEHAFGSADIRVYQDPYCVMGLTGPFSWVVPTPENAPKTGIVNGFFSNSRRIAISQLYRHLAEFRASSSVVHAPAPWAVAGQQAGAATYDITAASDGVLNQDTLLVVIPAEMAADGTTTGEIMFEYRRPKPDDWDRALPGPTVVVHSIGLARNVPLPGQGEVRPSWYEAAIAPDDYWQDPEHDLVVEFINRDDDDSEARIRISTKADVLAKVAFNPPTMPVHDLVKLESGMVRPAPVGLCTFDKDYPQDTYGVREEVNYWFTATGIINPTVTWYIDEEALTGAIDTTVALNNYKRAHLIRNGVVITKHHLQTHLAYRLNADGSLSITKDEVDGTFNVAVSVTVTGFNPTIGSVTRSAYAGFAFSEDIMMIGGTYAAELEACLHRPVVWPNNKVPVGPSDGPDFGGFPHGPGPLPIVDVPEWVAQINVEQSDEEVLTVLQEGMRDGALADQRLAVLSLTAAGLDRQRIWSLMGDLKR